MLAWLEGQLARQGYQAREVEQLAVSDLSCILHIQTNRGELYLKCCDPAFPHEPALTQALSQFWPASVPRVLAINLPQNWMLMETPGRYWMNGIQRKRAIWPVGRKLSRHMSECRLRPLASAIICSVRAAQIGV